VRPRVAITGIGAISSVAPDANGFVDALRSGRRGFSALSDPRLSSLRATHAGLIPDLVPDPADPTEVRVLDRNVHIALRALREAVARAGLDRQPLGPRAGIVLGTCSGGMLSIERHYEALVRGEDPLDPALLFSKRYYTTAKVLAWAVGAAGPAMTVVTACAAGAGAICQGADLIRAGLADLIVAGGADAFAPSTLVGFDALKATCEEMCAPFSSPVGLNLGEGGAFLVLERLEHVLERGAMPLAELVGSGLSNDAYHPTAPDPSARGQAAAMAAALDDAGVAPERVDYVNAHGTGTRANDPAETRAIARLLGDHARNVPVSSTKSMIGHCLGGAGALEAAATLLAARAGIVPPTAGFTAAREGCDLDYVPDPGREWQGRLALSNSFGFAGNNACLLVDVRPDIEAPVAALREPAEEQAVITGIGLITALGVGAEPLAGDRVGVGQVSRFPVPAAGFEAGLVPEIDPRQVDRRLDLRGLDRCSRYTALATRTALQHAGLRPRPSAAAKMGLVLGIATGPGQGEAEHLQTTFENRFELSSVGAFPYVVPNEVAGNVARALMLKGHSTVVATGAGAGLASLISAAVAVEQDHSEMVIAAAADELTERSAADGHKLGLWGPGTEVVPGEGAAAMVVEQPDAASERGAEALAQVLGYAMATDPTRPCDGDRLGVLARALEEAIDRSGIDPRQVEAVAGGCPAVDGARAEEVALKRIFRRPLRPFSLVGRIGCAEAALPLVNLAFLLGGAEPGAVLAAVSTSAEGFAQALIVRAGSPR
jgi:3-oxoacyl-[acyl-carrier-protein] synthase II